ncbi:MAG: hypothetical protein AAFZ18_36145 [Myxococcota bacterium]
MPRFALGAVFLCGTSVSCGAELVEFPCDIREGACQEHIFEATTALRGDERVALPKVTFISIEEHWELLDDEAPGEDAELIDAALVALRLRPKPEDRSSGGGDTVRGGFYTAGSDEVVVVDRGDLASSEWNKLLAHEFVHYLQDRAHDLLDYPRTSSDAQIAFRALLEGEATYLGDRFEIESSDSLDADLDWPELYRGQWGRVLSRARKGQWDGISSWLPYTLGAEVYARGVDRALLLDSRERGNVRGWLNGQPERPLDPMSCLPPLPPEGWRLEMLDRLGASAVLARTLDVSTARAIGNDRVAIYLREDEETVVLWHLDTDEAEAADLAQKLGGDLVDGRVVQLIMATRPETEALFAGLECGNEEALAAIDADFGRIGAYLEGLPTEASVLDLHP